MFGMMPVSRWIESPVTSPSMLHGRRDIWDRPDLSLRPQAHLQEAGAMCGDIHRKGVSREVSPGTIFPWYLPMLWTVVDIAMGGGDSLPPQAAELPESLSSSFTLLAPWIDGRSPEGDRKIYIVNF